MTAIDLDALMGIALVEARAAVEHHDVPVGAVVAKLATGEVVARRHNERELLADPTAHAEILALRDAAISQGSWRLEGHLLVVTRHARDVSRRALPPSFDEQERPCATCPAQGVAA